MLAVPGEDRRRFTASLPRDGQSARYYLHYEYNPTCLVLGGAAVTSAAGAAADALYR